MPGQANINGQAFSFVDAKLTIAGVELFSATQIVAKVTQEKVNNKGNQPELKQEAEEQRNMRQVLTLQ